MSEQAPILFIKTGVTHSVPEGFFSLLADVFDAKIFSSINFKNAHASGGKPNSKVRRNANAAAENRVMESLSKGSNVILNNFLNTKARREQVTQRAIDLGCGVIPVLLCVETPLPIITKRISERFGPEKLSHEYGKARTMHRNMEWPQDNESCLRLDGSREVAQLVANVQEHLAQLAIGVPTTPEPAPQR